MIEIALILFYSILISMFTYVIASYLIKKFEISHPSNRFTVLILVLLTVFSTMFFVGQNQHDEQITDVTSEVLSDIPISSSAPWNSQQNQSSDSRSIEHIRNASAPNQSFQTFAQTPYHSTITSYFIYENVPFSGLFYEDTSVQVKEQPVSSTSTPQFVSSESTNAMSLFIFIQLLLVLAGIAFVLFSLFSGKKYTLKKMKAVPCTNDTILEIISTVSKKMNMKPPRVFTAKSAPNAFVFAYPRSIVLSESLLEILSDKELGMVIKHEMSHIKNHDIIIKPVLQMLRIMFIYNPVIHLLYYRLIKERELLADLHFLHDKNDKICFMETLMKINAQIGQYHDSLFHSSLKQSSLLSLLPYKDSKVGLSERFNCLFGKTIRKTLITVFLITILLITNIGLIAMAQDLLNPVDQGTISKIDDTDAVEVTFTLVVKEEQRFQRTTKENILLIKETFAYAYPSASDDSHNQRKSPYEIISLFHQQVITHLLRANLDLSLLQWIEGTDQRLNLASPL